MQSLVATIDSHANPSIANHSQRFFKTGIGEYGEGDVFIGIRVPVLRQIAKQYLHLSVEDVASTLQSPRHEQRLCALLIWVYQYPKTTETNKEAIYQKYLNHTQFINNWDLVDSSAHNIVGAHLLNRKRDILHQLSRSADLWERRISMMSCFYYIKQNDFSDALLIAQQLLEDQHDLIHKVAGWMLREIGKRDLEAETLFLDRYYHFMPRTMLRYAIERLPEPMGKLT